VLTHEPQPLRFGSSCEVTIITGRERIIFALLGIRSKDFLKRRYEHHRRRRAAARELLMPVPESTEAEKTGEK